MLKKWRHVEATELGRVLILVSGSSTCWEYGEWIEYKGAW